MITLMQKLGQLGSPQQTSAPTSMDQIKVPQQPMDLAGTIPAANDQISYAGAQKAVDGNVDWASTGMGLLAGAAGSMGGGQQQQPQQQQQVQHAPQYRGGRSPEAFNAEKISAMRLAQQQAFAKTPGLMQKGQ